jgi:hypothetical protein
MRERLHVQRRQIAPKEGGWSERLQRPSVDAPTTDLPGTGHDSPGTPLDSATRNHFESRFGHDFSQVRIFDDAQAADAAHALGARAYTEGSSIVFDEGQYAPEAGTGRVLLAHELAHVAQDSSADQGRRQDATPRLSKRDDADEQTAHSAARSVTSGLQVHMPLAASSNPVEVHRWPWDDEGPKESGGGGSILDSATSALSTVGDYAAGGAKAAYQGYEKATDFRGAANDLGKGVDWVEQQSAAGNQKMVEDAKGIPVLEQLAQASAFVNTQTTDLAGGVVKGVGDLASGAANAVFHPIDAAAGIEGILEHNSTVPFLSTTLKAGHGLYDLAANGGGQYGSSMGDLANHLFNPEQVAKDDVNYDSALARGILTPGAKNWDESWQRIKDNPMDTLGRAGVNVAPMVLGAGELGAGEDAGQLSNVPETGPPVSEPPPTLRTPYAPEGVPEPPPFDPDITGPPSAKPPVPAEQPVPESVDPANPNGPTTYKPTGSNEPAWRPNEFPGDPPPSTPPGFEGLPRPYQAPGTSTPLFPDQIPDSGIIEEPKSSIPERPPNTVIEEPPSSGVPAPDTIPDDPALR